MISLMSHDPLTLLEAWLAEHAETRRFAAGARLFAVGEAPASLFWVADGELHLVRHGEQGERVIVQRCTRGPLAEASFFSGCYHCEGVAAVDTHAWVLSRKAFDAALDEPEFSRAYIAWLSTAIRGLRAQCERLSLPRAADRVLHYLREFGHYDFDGATLKDWAAALGITHEHLYRTLSQMQKSGRIRRDAHVIRLP